MTKVMISAEQAATLLPRGKKIHTYFRVFGWIGATVDRQKVLAAFESAKNVEVSSDAACLGHHLVVKMDGVRTYIETDQRAFQKLHPSLADS